MSDVPALSRPVDISRINAAGIVERIEATEHERAALAASLGIVAIGKLAAEVMLDRNARGLIRLDGRLTAEIVQNCVVSLVPVAQAIDEPISLRFAEEGSSAAKTPPKPATEIRVDPAEEDPAEVLTGTAIDLGPIVVEHLVLAIDPYPRAPGATLPDNPAEDQPGPGDSPFAVLAGLTRTRPKNR
jgi:uncharacterized metal-binding protein YceD (DUF177 family)